MLLEKILLKYLIVICTVALSKREERSSSWVQLENSSYKITVDRKCKSRRLTLVAHESTIRPLTFEIKVPQPQSRSSESPLPCSNYEQRDRLQRS